MKKLFLLSTMILSFGIISGTAFAQNAGRFVNVLPEKVRTVALIAPGLYSSRAVCQSGIQLLQDAGYKLKIMPNTFVRQKNIAQAPLAGRLSDFYTAWNDPEVDMILCIRGGMGNEEVMDNIDWSKLKNRPELYFQGFSDVTFTNCALLHKKLGHPVAGPSVRTLAGLTDDSIAAMRAMHQGEQVGPIQLKALVPGDCKGLPIAGLLPVFAIVVDKEYCPDTAGRIIFIEGVGIRAADVKAQLEKLLAKNFFDKAAGIVFCQFVRCNPADEVEKIIDEFALKMKIPVYKGFPLGHTTRHYAVDLQRSAEIKDGKIVFPAVKK